MSNSTLVDFGPTKPTIQPYQGGYSIPAALTQVEVPGVNEGETALSWRGYLLQVPYLSELELNSAFAELPAGDYSEERYAALEFAAKVERLNQYPPFVELEYAQAQENAAAALERSASTPEMQAYVAEVDAVDAEVPMPVEPSFMWSDVVDASGPSADFRFDPADPQFLQLQVGDRIRRTEPFGVMPYDAELLTISTSDGVTTWSESTTVSGSNVPFKVSTYRP